MWHGSSKPCFEVLTQGKLAFSVAKLGECQFVVATYDVTSPKIMLGKEGNPMWMIQLGLGSTHLVVSH